MNAISQQLQAICEAWDLARRRRQECIDFQGLDEDLSRRLQADLPAAEAILEDEFNRVRGVVTELALTLLRVALQYDPQAIRGLLVEILRPELESMAKSIVDLKRKRT